MSNCVGFRSNIVLNGDRDIDITDFMTMVRSYENLPEAPDDTQGSYVWWYLSGNVHIIGKTLIINLGQSRSSHTFRDFRGMLISCFKPFLKREDIVLNLVAIDRENPQDGWWHWQVRADGKEL